MVEQAAARIAPCTPAKGAPERVRERERDREGGKERVREGARK